MHLLKQVTHFNKETSVLGCEGVFDEVVSAFSMDRDVFIFRVEQLRLFNFFIPFSENEDITIVRKVKICSRHRKKAGHFSKVAVRISHRACVNELQAILLSNRHLTFQSPLQ
jgi:hypothetical protein